MDIDALVFDVGDRVTGWGQILQVGPSLWFDPPHTAGLNELTSRPRRRSRRAVRLLHADPSIVGCLGGDEGTRPGWGTVTGIWLGSAGPGSYGHDVIDVVSQSLSPIDPPPSGRGQSTSPRAAESQWSSAQIDRARKDLIKHWDDWTVHTMSAHAGVNGRDHLDVDLFRVLPAMARWSVSIPDGLVTVVASLTPDR